MAVEAFGPTRAETGGTALRFDRVDVVRGETSVLHQVSWQVSAGEHWAVLGPNGSGKTTMLQLASGYLHPTRGTVEILGHVLGRVDVRRLRERIGVVSAAVARMLMPSVAATEVVMSARHAALEPWWHQYTPDDRRRAVDLLTQAGFESVADRPFGVLSEGERQQVLLARSLMTDPDLVRRLGRLARDADAPASVLVTHHVEEIPALFSHLLLLRQGRVVVAGPIGEVLRTDTLSSCFGLGLRLESHAGRWTCRAVPPS